MINIEYLEKISVDNKSRLGNNLKTLLDAYHKSSLGNNNKLQYEILKANLKDAGGLNSSIYAQKKALKASNYGRYLKNPNKLNDNTQRYPGKIFNNKSGYVDNVISEKILPYYKNIGAIEQKEKVATQEKVAVNQLGHIIQTMPGRLALTAGQLMSAKPTGISPIRLVTHNSPVHDTVIDLLNTTNYSRRPHSEILQSMKDLSGDSIISDSIADHPYNYTGTTEPSISKKNLVPSTPKLNTLMKRLQAANKKRRDLKSQIMSQIRKALRRVK